MPTHLFAALLSLFTTLAFSLYMAIVPLHRWFNERADAHHLLGEALQAIQAKLPPAAASETEIGSSMPLHPHPLLREGFRYYPERQAYKYTFERRWSWPRHGSGSHYQKRDDFPPEPLERRSIWFQARNGQWHCHAGVKNGVLGDLPCKDSSIVQGLSVKEHQSAMHIENCARLALILHGWQPSGKIHFLYLPRHESIHVNVFIHEPQKNIVIIADSFDRGEKIHRFFYTPETRIIGFITESKHSNDFYGLPNNIHILDYLNTFNECRTDKKKMNIPSISDQLKGSSHTFAYLKKDQTQNALTSQHNTLEQVPADAWQSAPTLLQDGVFKSVPTF